MRRVAVEDHCIRRRFFDPDLDATKTRTIGREEGNSLRLNDERVSRFHAKIQADNDEIILTDLESTNGTRVNGNIVQIRRLRPGDRIGLGRSLLLFGSEQEINEGQTADALRPRGATVPEVSGAPKEMVPWNLPGDRYRVVGEIARGGMGVVLRAFDSSFGRLLAIKLLLPREGARGGDERRLLEEARTLVWNGPLGAFETRPFDEASVAVAKKGGELTEAGKLLSVAGGGDTVAALAAAGVTAQLSYVSTAGGAFLEWLEGRELPGVAALAAASSAAPAGDAA